MSFSGKMHRAIINTLIELCDQSLEEGPRRGFSSPYESEHSNGGYLTMSRFISCLQRVLTDEIPGFEISPLGEARFHGLFCGGLRICWLPFNISFSSLNSDLAHYCKQFVIILDRKVKNSNMIEQPLLPWSTIKRIMFSYKSHVMDLISESEDVPYHSLDTDMVLQGIVERVPGMIGPLSVPAMWSEWLISASCSSMRVRWMNDLLKRFFIEEGDSNIRQDVGARQGDGYRYDEGNDVYYLSSEDICQWWAEEIQSLIPRPPDSSPPPARPVVVEPVNETKKKLTEILAFVEENRETWNMNEGDYLKLSNLMKEAFNSV